MCQTVPVYITRNALVRCQSMKRETNTLNRSQLTRHLQLEIDKHQLKWPERQLFCSYVRLPHAMRVRGVDATVRGPFQHTFRCKTALRKMPFGPHQDIFRQSIFRFVSAFGENAVTKPLTCNDYLYLQLSGPGSFFSGPGSFFWNY